MQRVRQVGAIRVEHRRLTELVRPAQRVRGQVQVAQVDGQVVSVRLDPGDPPACPEAVTAVEAADWVVIGPGSWFTSIMPTLLVPGLRDALITTTAKRVLVLNQIGRAHV